MEFLHFWRLILPRISALLGLMDSIDEVLTMESDFHESGSGSILLRQFAHDFHDVHSGISFRHGPRATA